jgi:hypothetical protein
MSAPQPPRRYGRAETELADSMSWDAVSALTFVSEPGVWPAFAAWAEQLEPEGPPFTEADRRRMAIAARIFLRFAETCDRMLGQ